MRIIIDRTTSSMNTATSLIRVHIFTCPSSLETEKAIKKFFLKLFFSISLPVICSGDLNYTISIVLSCSCKTLNLGENSKIHYSKHLSLLKFNKPQYSVSFVVSRSIKKNLSIFMSFLNIFPRGKVWGYPVSLIL